MANFKVGKVIGPGHGIVHVRPGEQLSGFTVVDTVLKKCLADALPAWAVQSTASRGIAPDQVEAIAFASFARRTVLGLPGNLPSVTGASRPCVLGAVYAV